VITTRCGQPSLLDRARSFLFPNRTPAPRLCDGCRDVLEAFADWKRVYFSSPRRANPPRTRRAGETVTATVTAGPGIAFQIRTGQREGAPCPLCGVAANDRSLPCIRCGERMHAECYWGRLASLDEWRVHIRHVAGLEHEWDADVVCATCRAERNGVIRR
jgi:hypothetical protein